MSRKNAENIDDKLQEKSVTRLELIYHCLNRCDNLLSSLYSEKGFFHTQKNRKFGWRNGRRLLTPPWGCSSLRFVLSSSFLRLSHQQPFPSWRSMSPNLLSIRCPPGHIVRCVLFRGLFRVRCRIQSVKVVAVSLSQLRYYYNKGPQRAERSEFSHLVIYNGPLVMVNYPTAQ